MKKHSCLQGFQNSKKLSTFVKAFPVAFNTSIDIPYFPGASLFSISLSTCLISVRLISRCGSQFIFFTLMFRFLIIFLMVLFFRYKDLHCTFALLLIFFYRVFLLLCYVLVYLFILFQMLVLGTSSFDFFL